MHCFRFAAVLVSVILISGTSGTLVSAQDWSAFLGSQGKAKFAGDNIPIQWDDAKNVLWSMDLPGSGSASPAIVGDRVIVVCHVETPKAMRQVLCFDKNKGEKLWSVDFPIDYREDGFRGYLMEHGYASNTPVSDGENVYVFLGKGGVHALTLDGEKKWSFDAGKGSSNREWGSAASLTLYKNIIIVNASEESKAIVALNKEDGKEIWREASGMLELSYNTPRIVSRDDGNDELVISVPGEIWSMNPETGKLKWLAKTPMAGNVSPSLIVDGDTIYGFGGYRSVGSIAVKVGGKKDVTNSNVLWTSRTTSYVATPLLHEGRFYWIDDRGLAFCSSAKDGKVVYKERVSGLTGRPVYASPVLIGGNIYVVTRRGGTIVYPPGDSFKPIATNRFAKDGSDFNASPAVSDGKLFLRSNQTLYCVSR